MLWIKKIKRDCKASFMILFHILFETHFDISVVMATPLTTNV